MKTFHWILLVLSLAFPLLSKATITVDAPYANSMVLPSNTDMDMYFGSDSDRPVTVTPSWSQSKTFQRVGRGRIPMRLHTLISGGPHSIVLSDGVSTTTISDIYFGKVILVSGQSNAEMPMYLPNSGYPLIPEGLSEFNEANYPQIRFTIVQQTNSPFPQINPPIPVIWKKGNSSERGRASAIGWRAAKLLHLATGEPVGILSITYGGTAIERWIPRDVLSATPYGAEQLTYPSNVLWCQAYNAMMFPFRNFAVNSIIWYQGEGNVWTYNTYGARLKALLQYMQCEFGNKTLTPSLFCVEIAPYTGYTNSGSPYIRMQQSQVAAEIGAHFIPTSDSTDITNIHSTCKFPIGDRIGRMLIDERNNLVPKPQFRIVDQVILGTEITLTFNGANSITMTRPDGFWVVTSQGTLTPATATVSGNTIVVSSPVQNPVAVRYGWQNEFVASVFNEDGMPLAIYAQDGVH